VADVDVAKEAAKVFAKQGLKIIQLGVKIGEVKVGKKGVSIDYTDKDGQGAEARRRPPDRLGRPRPEHRRPECRSRRPQATTERGQIEVDDHCRTNLPGVWAVGDVVPARCWRTRRWKRA
jgi:dihydrolipoamide dehydrogenase